MSKQFCEASDGIAYAFGEAAVGVLCVWMNENPQHTTRGPSRAPTSGKHSFSMAGPTQLSEGLCAFMEGADPDGAGRGARTVGLRSPVRPPARIGIHSPHRSGRQHVELQHDARNQQAGHGWRRGPAANEVFETASRTLDRVQKLDAPGSFLRTSSARH